MVNGIATSARLAPVRVMSPMVCVDFVCEYRLCVLSNLHSNVNLKG